MTPGPYRLPCGGEIDRGREVAFRFDGKRYLGHPGDTLASALLANGVRTVARSFKFHRPRGIFSCGAEEPNALFQVGSGAQAVPAARATLTELTAGLEAYPTAGWPNLVLDAGRVLDAVAPLWAAGFYNKTFIWPGWHAYEGMIRRMAGLGRAPAGPDPDRYDIHNLHCDVLVVGGGVAGLKAAVGAHGAGARVVLAEQDRTLGGQAHYDGSKNQLSSAMTWVRDATLSLARRPEARVLTRTTAVGSYDHGVFTLLERSVSQDSNAPRERYWIVRAKRVVLATGALEQPLIFCHNDRPGILLAGAARQYLHRYGVCPGRCILIATNNDSAYALARELKEAGATVLAVVDSRHEVAESLRIAMRSLAVAWFPGSIPTDTSGFNALRSVTVGRLSRDARSVEAFQTFKCDALAVSGGFSPALQLYAQANGRLAYDDTSGALQPVLGGTRASIEIVGSAADRIPIGPRLSPVGRTHRQWVDLLHDVTVADLEISVRENYTAVEHVKRYTTVGMAADQGKTSAAATLGILGRLQGIAPGDLGHTTLRPPVTPVTLGAIAGREVGEWFAPRRLLPMHSWHTANGAEYQDFGTWQRPVAYLRSNENREQAAAREARAVRTAAGLFDGSSLGKIEIQGPDALEFLDRFYINNLKTLQPGRVRYGLMLRETGIIFDDGTVVALAPDHLLITTTSGNAGRVHQWLEEWHQCEWPDLHVAITPVTEHWATLSLAGPEARAILQRLDADIDVSREAFPHLTMREGKLLGNPARIYRVSFTGELTYEINVPADTASTLWETLMSVGASNGLQPFGLEALQSLRLEKGFLHIGTDTDGSTVPDDVGWGKVAANKTRDYIGKRSLALPEHIRSDRLQLVGLVLPREKGRGGDSGSIAFAAGSHIRSNPSTHPTDGWVTSAGLGVGTGEPIALAMIRAGRQHFGDEVTVYDAGIGVARARVVSPPFFDPSGEHMNA